MKFWCDRCEVLVNEEGTKTFHGQYCDKCIEYINTYDDDYDENGELSATDMLLAEYEIKGGKNVY